MKPERHLHCTFCGHRFPEGDFPKTCAECRRTTWLNPAPVAVMLLPVDDGLLVVRRGINPGKGLLALPGGFIDLGESWQKAACRELREETGVLVDPGDVSLHHVGNADGFILIFAMGPHRVGDTLEPFEPVEEVQERLVITTPEELAFPLHTELARRYFDSSAASPDRKEEDP